MGVPSDIPPQRTGTVPSRRDKVSALHGKIGGSLRCMEKNKRIIALHGHAGQCIAQSTTWIAASH